MAFVKVDCETDCLNPDYTNKNYRPQECFEQCGKHVVEVEDTENEKIFTDILAEISSLRILVCVLIVFFILLVLLLTFLACWLVFPRSRLRKKLQKYLSKTKSDVKDDPEVYVNEKAIQETPSRMPSESQLEDEARIEVCYDNFANSVSSIPQCSPTTSEQVTPGRSQRQVSEDEYATSSIRNETMMTIVT